MQRSSRFFSPLLLMLILSMALAGCARQTIRDPRVLVLDFESTLSEPGVPDGPSLAELMEQNLVNQPRVAMVTRQGMQSLMQKAIARQMSPVDVGLRANADYVVIGSLTRAGGGNYVLNARLLSTATGDIVPNSSVTRACRQERDIYPLVQAVAKASAWQLRVLAEYADQAARGEPLELPAFAREGQPR
ncbi:hypothetical protein LLG95_18230 [bacterium]|nr:hypothetical protein [bacterium]